MENENKLENVEEMVIESSNENSEMDNDEIVNMAIEQNDGLENKPKNKKIKLIVILASAIVGLGIVVAILFYMFSPSVKYNNALDLIAEATYDEAIVEFKELGDYEDSKKKIVECNRRKLYDKLEKSGKVQLGSEYSMYVKGDRICFNSYELEGLNSGSGYAEVELSLCVDMESNDGEYETIYDYTSRYYSQESTCKGKVNIAEITKGNNSLKVESYTGPIGQSTMKGLADVYMDLLAYKIDPMLEKTGLKLTAKDIGFTSIGK